ncbi:MAG: tetratricopeptide repeat protein [Cyanobacteria bacterium J06648_1]
MSHTIGQAKEDTQESNSNSNQPPQDSLTSEVSSSKANSGLSDADYEFLFNQLLEGIAHGWHDRRIIKFFKQLGDRGAQENWVAWLDRLRNKVLSLPIQSKRQLGTMMIRLGELTQSATEVNQIGAASHRIGRELLFGKTPAEIWEYVGPDLPPPSNQIETEQELSARLPDEFTALGADGVDEAKLDLGTEVKSPWDSDLDGDQDHISESDLTIEPQIADKEETEGINEKSSSATTATQDNTQTENSDANISLGAAPAEIDLDLDLDLEESNREFDDHQNIDAVGSTSDGISLEQEQDLDLSLVSDAEGNGSADAEAINLDLDLGLDVSDKVANEPEEGHETKSALDDVALEDNKDLDLDLDLPLAHLDSDPKASIDEISLDLDLDQRSQQAPSFYGGVICDLDEEQDTPEEVTSYGEEFEFELNTAEPRLEETETAVVEPALESQSPGVAADLLSEQPISAPNKPNKLSEALQAFELEAEPESSLADHVAHSVEATEQTAAARNSLVFEGHSEVLASQTTTEQKLDDSSLEVIESWFNLGLKQVSAGEYNEAIASWDKALTINANLAEAWHNRGSALGRLGDYEAAVESFQNALQIDPDNYQAWNDRAHALYQLQNWSSAIESWSQAIKIMPGNHLLWYNRGCALEQLEKWQDAIASYEKALEIKPDFQPGRSRYINLVADNSRPN